MKFKKIKKIFRNLSSLLLSEREVNIQFQLACKNNNLEEVKYWLTSKYIINKADINYANGIGLWLAIKNNNLEIVKYLLTSPELKKHADITLDNSQLLITACLTNNIQMVKYLLTSPELKTHLNIHEDIERHYHKENIPNFILVFLAKKHNTRILEYLLTSPDLKGKLSLSDETDKIFKAAFKTDNFGKGADLQKFEYIKFLITELNIQKTPFIEHFLKNNKANKSNNYSTLAIDIMEVFKRQALHKKLKEKLEDKPLKKSPRNKI